MIEIEQQIKEYDKRFLFQLAWKEWRMQEVNGAFNRVGLINAYINKYIYI